MGGKGEKGIARQDLLRSLAEAGGEAPVARLLSEVGDEELAVEALGELEREGLVRLEDGVARLTAEGRREAERLLERHRAIERLASRLRLDPHVVAHALEHLELSPEFLEKVLGPGRLRRLTDLKPGEEARVAVILEHRPRLLARLYGVGVAPGRRIRLLGRGPGFLVVETGVEARPAVLDVDVASRVLVKQP